MVEPGAGAFSGIGGTSEKETIGSIGNIANKTAKVAVRMIGSQYLEAPTYTKRRSERLKKERLFDMRIQRRVNTK